VFLSHVGTFSLRRWDGTVEKRGMKHVLRRQAVIFSRRVHRLSYDEGKAELHFIDSGIAMICRNLLICGYDCNISCTCRYQMKLQRRKLMACAYLLSSVLHWLPLLMLAWYQYCVQFVRRVPKEKTRLEEHIYYKQSKMYSVCMKAITWLTIKRWSAGISSWRLG
jgi:hypothetical protein